ncbi:MAG: hypothetical protein DMF61_05615 [Blastocatellia bacterium AA13]|nr:MAG: hypothetical protein DMF61_05615 [Blastocatellia bacterium AA13]
MEPSTRKLLHSLSALADLGAEISSTHDFEEVMDASLHTMLGTLAISRGAIARFSNRPLQLKVIAAKGSKTAKGQKITLGDEEAEYLASRSAPVAPIADGNGLAEFGKRNIELLKKLRASSVAPVVARGELMGVILISEKFDRDGLSEQDRAIIGTIARHIGIAMYNHRLMISLKRKAEENRRLYRGMRQMYHDTIRAFAAAIDLKDAYTSGHSDRVARYSEAIAKEMGLTGTELEYIGVAGHLHDIGKITVDRAIINNPRPLTEPEFLELNKHVMTGYEILSSIGHPWSEIAYMTKCHHERVDGRGYPQGLKGDQIPLGAKIVTVADSFDAMMTDRPYRSRLPLQKALVELQRNIGKQFAPEVIAAFCRLLKKEITGEVRSRVLTMTVGRKFERDAVDSMLSNILGSVELTAAGVIC